MQTQLKVMFELQDSMNTRVNLDWRNQGNEWYRAIWVECAELMDHYGWKWWKQQEPDIEQVRLELVDIWHFGLSILLEKKCSPTILLMELEEAFGAHKSNDFHEILESFVEYTLVERDFNVPLFIALLDSVGMSFEELYCSYVGKNVLNFFRQDHGYQEGTYQKIWGGKEDNEHLVELMAQLDDSDRQFSDKLYSHLSRRYRLYQ